jgi:prephenate dehydrogenase
MESAFYIPRLVVCGLGLIGGSLAKALKDKGCVGEVVGWGRRESSLQKGVDLGVIDRFSLDLAEAVKDADVLFIATPTLIAEVVLEQLAEIQNQLPERLVITDGASVKGNLHRKAQSLYGKIPSNLVLGHPIAGSEQSGVSAAKSDLYLNHKVILTPDENTSPDALQLVRRMWECVGAEVVDMGVAEHDEILAATSHLPHVLAYALVDALSSQTRHDDIFRFAAGGFRDFTRIASSDPTMWHDISLANKTAIVSMIDLFSEQLQHLRTAIEDSDSTAIMASFGQAKIARDDFAHRLQKNKLDS